MVYLEPYDSHSDALRREYEVKHFSTSAKRALIQRPSVESST